jgi:ferrous iron transport protein A
LIPVPLQLLRPGHVAEVQELVGPAEHVRRLEELGLRSGAVLEMIRSGSPCIVRVGGSTLCFRGHELAQVLVTPRMTA